LSESGESEDEKNRDEMCVQELLEYEEKMAKINE
jgi:hypothetical protein